MLRLWGSVPFFILAAFTIEKGQHQACLTKKSLLVMGANGKPHEKQNRNVSHSFFLSHETLAGCRPEQRCQPNALSLWPAVNHGYQCCYTSPCYPCLVKKCLCLQQWVSQLTIVEFHDRTTVVCVVFGMEKSSMVKFVGTGLAIAGALIMLEVESFGNCCT